MARASPADSGQSAQDTPAPSNKVPTSTVIVAVVVTLVGITLIAGIGYCIYRAWKRRKAREGSLAFVVDSNNRTRRDVFGKNKSWDLETISVQEEKPDVVQLERPRRAIVVASDDGSTWRSSGEGSVSHDGYQHSGWVPQIKSKYGANILAPKPSLKKHQPTESQQPVVMHYTAPSLTGSEILGISPPPSYFSANQAGASIGGVLSGVTEVNFDGERRAMLDVKTIPVPPIPLQDARLQAPPPTPPAGSTRFILDPSAPAMPPLKSPARSESFVAADTSPAAVPPPSLPQEHPKASTSGHVRNNSNQSISSRMSSTSERAELPRLMSVVATFNPTLEDELPVRIGDTVRMLEEYKDGWCSAQYVGRFGAAKGVVPRFCLQERKSVVPTHKASNSSLSSSISRGSFRR